MNKEVLSLTYVFGLYIIAVNFFQKHKRGIQTFLLLLFMALISAGCYSCSDYGNYYNGYYKLVEQPFEKGFLLLCDLFGKTGMSFELFHGLFYVAFLVVLYMTLRHYTKNRFEILFLYLLYPFMWDIVQMRHAAAFLIMFVAFQYLLVPGWINDVKYAILIGIASMFHTVAVWYFLFLPAKHIKHKKKLIICVVVITFIGCACAYSGLLESVLSALISRYRTERYFQSRAHLGVVLGWARVVAPMLAFLILHKMHERYEKKSEDKHVITHKKISIRGGKLYLTPDPIDYHCFSDMLFKVNCVNLIVCVLMCFSGNFYRIIRSLLIFNYIYAVHVYSIDQTKSTNKRLELLCLVCCFLLVAGDDYFFTWEGVVAQIMKYNFLNDAVAGFLSMP